MNRLSLFLTLLLSVCFLQQTFSQSAPEGGDHSGSPYFIVKSDHPGEDALPLKATAATVNIAGVIADVTVTQVYENTGKNALEAIYVFPASSKAAVYGMKMTLGDRTITAKVKERAQARKDYEAAKSEGKTASLLEQQRPNVFQMNVANILPGDRIEVELKYTEMLVPEAGTYQFVYPTVVGPRFTTGSDQERDAFTATPYTRKGVEPAYDFDLQVHLSAGMPIQHIASSSHQIDVAHSGLKEADISLASTEAKSGNKDFILDYRLAGGKIESGMILYEHEDENFFMAMVQPPARVTPEQIPGREYVFIVDVSGSMNGWPLSVSKRLLRNLISGLKPTDKFNVMLFAGTAVVMADESIYANEANIERALNVLENQRGGGGTQIYPALQQALQMPCDESMSRSFVVVTDGYISVEKECFDLIRDNLNQANLYPFGIGSGVNRFLIEGMAHVGMTEPIIVTSEQEAHLAAEKFRKYIASPVLTHIDLDFEGFDAYDVEPRTLPDVLAERPVILHGKYKGVPAGKIILKGIAGKQSYRQELKVAEYAPSQKNSALRYLWARKRIQMLDDYKEVSYGDDAQGEVTALGLQYSLMTAYTSFIAVDEVIRRNAKGELITVRQPIPLPDKVENTAVGFDLAIEGEAVQEKSPNSKQNATHLSAGTPTAVNMMGMERELSNWINQNLGDLEGCERLMKGNMTRIQVEITLDAQGNVKAVQFPGGGTQTILERTLRALIGKWKFKGTLPSAMIFQFPLTLRK